MVFMSWPFSVCMADLGNVGRALTCKPVSYSFLDIVSFDFTAMPIALLGVVVLLRGASALRGPADFDFGADAFDAPAELSA